MSIEWFYILNLMQFILQHFQSSNQYGYQTSCAHYAGYMFFLQLQVLCRKATSAENVWWTFGFDEFRFRFIFLTFYLFILNLSCLCRLSFWMHLLHFSIILYNSLPNYMNTIWHSLFESARVVKMQIEAKPWIIIRYCN